MQWQQVVRWVSGPPAAAPVTAPDAVTVSRPDVVPAGAPLSPDQEAAAFAAFEAMST